jgi:DedD protein
MAFFKFRKGADDSPRASGQPPSIEAIRQRAKYRLAGATVLVLVAVIGLPLLFDKQPRPIAVDTPIVIPDKTKVLPLAIPASPIKPAPASANTPAPTAPVVADKSAPAAQPSPATAAKPAADIITESKQPLTQVDKEQAATNSAAKEVPASTKPAASKTEANRALALLEGKTEPKSTDKALETASKVPKVVAHAPATVSDKSASATGDRFVVQVGAFADNAHAHEVRVKLERAGMKTYAQTADTKDGRRIRVRVGPFTSRAEAEKVAEKIKKLNLPAALLTL